MRPLRFSRGVRRDLEARQFPISRLAVSGWSRPQQETELNLLVSSNQGGEGEDGVREMEGWLGQGGAEGHRKGEDGGTRARGVEGTERI